MTTSILSRQRVLVTGANGFIGRHLVAALSSANIVYAATRSPAKFSGAENVVVGEVGPVTCWLNPLSESDTVVHLAGLAHGVGKRSESSIAEFQNVNVLGSVNLARQAVAAGVKRFVFLSSIGVNGPDNVVPFTEDSRPNPTRPYAISKHYAECALRDVFKGTSTELVIIRPPLVYAGDAPGNFAKLLQLVFRGVPLPLAKVANLRSMIALENLLDLIECCTVHPKAAGQLFLASDGLDVSTPEIVRALASGMGREARLVPAPVSAMRQAAKLVGRQALYGQLCGSLTIDSSKSRSLLGWRPVTDAWSALSRSGRNYALMASSR